jgi:LmbE family N-acetylglucosaminyl deacetylase
MIILAACCLAALLVLYHAARSRKAIYRYDVQVDQRFDFKRTSSSPISAKLRGGVLELPPIQTGDELWLELRIASKLLGLWFEPLIQVETPRGRLCQPCERNGSGVRFVSLSRRDFEGQASLRLIGRFLDIPDQLVKLHYLQHRADLDQQRILVLGTHPDDAEIAAFNLYSGRDSYVVTLTAGEAGELGPFKKFGTDAAAYREKGVTRAWNSTTVPMLGGVPITRTANLGYFDGTLKTMQEHPEAPVRSLHAAAEFLDAFGQAQNVDLMAPRRERAATWMNLVADLEHLVTTLQPDILVTPYPRLDEHPDHKMTTIALLQALKNLNWRRGSLLLYVNHLYSSDRYPFGQTGDLMSLPPGVDDLYFDNIVSRNLDERQQAKKHMALDAMIDLRPDITIDSVRSVAKAFQKVLRTTVTDGHVSYFRQAVRANELFFQVQVTSLYEPGVIERIVG